MEVRRKSSEEGVSPTSNMADSDSNMADPKFSTQKDEYSDSGNSTLSNNSSVQDFKQQNQTNCENELPLATLPEEPPALPPRPPYLALPRTMVPPPHAPAYLETRPHLPRTDDPVACKSWWNVLTRKYVILSWLSGGLCILLGVLFLVIHFLVVSRTSSLQYFQTIPAYIPAIVMICNGILVSVFSKGSLRYPSLIKLTGCFCLISSALCVVVTITTTVIHMNRLQTLRECVYQSSTKTCTCFAGILDPRSIEHEATLRYVFTGTSDCDVVHGTLYSCLRGMFGLSVIGILVSIFSCMLVYQILSHEKKKQYLQQLDSQCRTMYCRPGISRSVQSYCSTESNCQCSRQQLDYLNYRLWGRRCDNLYSPTPLNTMSTRTGTPSSLLGWGSSWSRGDPGPAGDQGHWRTSQADDVYGFRPGVGLSSSRQISSCYTVTDLLRKGMLGSSHVTGLQNDSLPNLLWGPPPPYSSSVPQGQDSALSQSLSNHLNPQISSSSSHPTFIPSPPSSSSISSPSSSSFITAPTAHPSQFTSNVNPTSQPQSITSQSSNPQSCSPAPTPSSSSFSPAPTPSSSSFSPAPTPSSSSFSPAPTPCPSIYSQILPAPIISPTESIPRKSKSGLVQDSRLNKYPQPAPSSFTRVTREPREPEEPERFKEPGELREPSQEKIQNYQSEGEEQSTHTYQTIQGEGRQNHTYQTIQGEGRPNHTYQTVPGEGGHIYQALQLRKRGENKHEEDLNEIRKALESLDQGIPRIQSRSIPYIFDAAGMKLGPDTGLSSWLGSEQVQVVADLHTATPQPNLYRNHSSPGSEEERKAQQDEKSQTLNLQTMLRSQSSGSIGTFPDSSYSGSKLTQRNMSTSYLSGAGIPQFISSPNYPDPNYPFSRLHPLSRLPDPNNPLSRLPDPNNPLSKLPDPGKTLSRLPDPNNPLSRLPDPGYPFSRLPDKNRPVSSIQDTLPVSHVSESSSCVSPPGNYSGNTDFSKPFSSQFSKHDSTSPAKQGAPTTLISPSRRMQGFLPNKILSGFVAAGSTNIAPISAKPAGFQSQPNLIGLPKLSSVSTYAVHEGNNKKKEKIFISGSKPCKPVSSISSQINALVSPTRLVSNRFSGSTDSTQAGETPPLNHGSVKPKSPPIVQPKPVLSPGSSREYFSSKPEPSSFNISPINKSFPPDSNSSNSTVSGFKPVLTKPQLGRHTEHRQHEVEGRQVQVESRDCVYLRPGQNIPDGFNYKFKPIGEDGEDEKSKNELYTSSDDIVLTLRSVQV